MAARACQLSYTAGSRQEGHPVRRWGLPRSFGASYRVLYPHSAAYITFLRHDARAGQTCLVVLNFSSEGQTLAFDLSGKQPRLLFSSHPRADQPLSLDRLNLAPFEIVIAELL